MSDDVRALLDPLVAVQDARPKFRAVPEQTYTPPVTDVDPTPTPIITPAYTQVFTDPADLPEEIVLPNGGVDLGGQLALVQAALGRLSDVQIRGVHASTTYNTTLIWPGLSSREVTLTWDAAPLAAVQFAIVRLDVGVAWQGKVSARMKPDSYTTDGCSVIVTVTSTAQVVITAALPLTVHADAIYNYVQPFAG